MVETYDRFKIDNLIKLAKTTSDELLKEKYLEQAYEELNAMNEKMVDKELPKCKSEQEIMQKCDVIYPKHYNNIHCHVDNVLYQDGGFGYVYEAEPMDWANGLMIPLDEWMKYLLDEKKMELDAYGDEFKRTVTEFDREEKRVQLIDKWLQKTGERLRSKIYVFPQIVGCQTSVVYCVKIDNNGTTYYMSDYELYFPNTQANLIG